VRDFNQKYLFVIFQEDVMAQLSYQLVMQTGPTPGKAYALDKGEINIGRDVNNDIVINDAEVSRSHARIIIQGDSCVLEDLGSTNGTSVDGKRLTGPHILYPGQRISLGENVSLGFEAIQYDPDATVVTTAEDFAEQPPAAVPPPAKEVQPVQQEEHYTPYPPPAQPDEHLTPYPPPPQPVYAGQVPTGQPEPAAPPERKTSTWLIGGCGCLVIILCIVVVATLWYIDSNLLWCDVFPIIPSCP
jgi:predicted component of type VI protein secretion system